MKILFSFIALALVLSLSQGSLAEQSPRPDHYKGEPSANLEEAVANFSEYNSRLEKILAKETLSPQDMNDIHQLTYTLENALEKMREEFSGLAEVLEEVHVASETVDTARVKANGNAYLNSARKMVK